MYKDVVSRGTIHDLLAAVMPRCRLCDDAATRRPTTPPPESEEFAFCDDHNLDELESYEGSYTDLPHAIPIRQLLGSIKEGDRVWCLKVVPPKEQARIGPHLMMVHEQFVVVKASAGTSQDAMEEALEAAQRATGKVEVLVITEGIELEVMSVVEPRSRYERLMEEDDGSGD